MGLGEEVCVLFGSGIANLDAGRGQTPRDRARASAEIRATVGKRRYLIT